MCSFLTCFSVSLALFGVFRSFRGRSYFPPEKKTFCPSLRKCHFMESKGITYPTMIPFLPSKSSLGPWRVCLPSRSTSTLGVCKAKFWTDQKMLQKWTFLALFFTFSPKMAKSANKSWKMQINLFAPTQHLYWLMSENTKSKKPCPISVH